MGKNELFKIALATGVATVNNSHDHPKLFTGCKVRIEILYPMFIETPWETVLGEIRNMNGILPNLSGLLVTQDLFGNEIYLFLDSSGGTLYSIAEERNLPGKRYPSGRTYEVPYVNSMNGERGDGSGIFFQNDAVYEEHYGHDTGSYNKGIESFPFSSLSNHKEYLLVLYIEK
jgi:hypothetical protein